jgi:hypothetical protein
MFPGSIRGRSSTSCADSSRSSTTHEAENQRLFTDYYAGHPFIRIPAVIDELSTARAHAEFAEGARFAEVEHWSQAERDIAAEAIFRFVFRSLYRLHAFNGDPHPGNYVFGGNGVVTFLDFGLVKRYDPAEVALFEELIRSMVLEHDIAQFRATLEAHSILRKDASFGNDDVREYFGHFYEFVESDEEIAFTPEYASETVRRMFDPSSPYAHVSRASNVPPAFVISQRINLGLHAVLGRLRAQRNWRRIAEESGRSSTGRRRRRWAKPKPPGSRAAPIEPSAAVPTWATCAQAERKRSRIPGSSNSPGTVSGPANAPSMTGTS